jgi:hypothetical protein
MNCRHCGKPLSHLFLDLGRAPPSNAYLSSPTEAEEYFPLRLYVCDSCWLVQTEDYARPEQLFARDYAYFSSVSTSWLQHAAEYAAMIIKRLQLDKHSQVIEIAANDGYLLKNFVAAGIPCLGIEPTASTATAAEKLGIPILRAFFGKTLAATLDKADLIIGNNVYAHVPDINDFTAGLKAALKPGGTITLEFPHLLRLIQHTQFDTVYHEHYSYLSLYTACRIFAKSGLHIIDVEELPTHGGSLRIYGAHAEDARPPSPAVAALLAAEESFGLRRLSPYQAFQKKADAIKQELLDFLVEQKRAGKTVVGYGAAAKGNTLLNYTGVTAELLPYVCDAAASKQEKYLPGSHIPVLAPEVLKERRPDVLLILPWNLREEIMTQYSYIRDWGGCFAVAVPKMMRYS